MNSSGEKNNNNTKQQIIMKINFLSILKYSISFLIAIAIFAYIYQGQDLGKMFNDLLATKWQWISLSMSLSLLSHVGRAWRWSLMFKPLGFQVGIYRPFLAVMVGYLANFILPRMGEVTRCTILQRTNAIPFQQSFGTVIAERAIDFICLVIVTLLTIFIEFDKLASVLNDIFNQGQTQEGSHLKWILLGIVLIGSLIALGIWTLFKKKIQALDIYKKIIWILLGLRDGFMSVLKLDKQDRVLFFVHTFAIWFLYLVTFYVLFFALTETSQLDIYCALAGLAMSGVAIVAPVQGGIGVYHYLISKTLETYGIGENTAKFFAFMSHNSQVILWVVVGSICLLLSLLVKKSN
ncbi:MAG: lysylphosphatidylglycerol synthase transmembrane domain-containing protein [Thermoflexibacter sp.]